MTALRRGVQEADVVLTTGGTSMGEGDLLKPLLERKLGAQVWFGRVAMKPGKPTTFATLASSNRVIFALPGNPASALVCFYVFVMPALRRLSGWGAGMAPGAAAGQGMGVAHALKKIKVQLGYDVKLDTRAEFQRVVVGLQDGRWVATSTGKQRSR
ncbi:hypothetical protein ACQY0O_005243 [Thecaphora frezii]